MDVELKVVNAHVLEPDKHYILEFNNKDGLSIENVINYCSHLKQTLHKNGLDNITIIITDKDRIKLYET